MRCDLVLRFNVFLWALGERNIRFFFYPLGFILVDWRFFF